MTLRRTIQVLIAEDNPSDAQRATLALRRHGLNCRCRRVETAAGLRQALAERSWDIVLCDHSMAQLDVAQVLAALGGKGGPVPVVMVTGTVGETVIADMMRLGMADVVLKHHLADRLGPVVEREVTQARIRAGRERRRRRSDAVLEAFNRADDWMTAARDSLKVLATSLGAEIALMAEIVGRDPMLHPISVWTTPGFETVGREIATQILPAELTLAGRAALKGHPVVLADLTAHATEGSYLVATSATAGLDGLVIQPLRAAGRDFLVSMLFAGRRDDLDRVQLELADISAVMQPLLRRRIGEAERTLLRRALDAASSGVIITEADQLDPPGPRIVYANHAICHMSGRDHAELLGQTPRLLQGPLTDPAALARIRRALRAARPITEELQNQRPDGTPFWVKLDITPVFDKDRPTHFIAIQTDITQRRAEARERQEREASFRLLFEGNPMPMWVCDSDSLAFLEVNSAAVARYGWPREVFLQHSVHLLSPDAEHVRQRIDVGLAAPGAMVGARHITASGETMAVRIASHAITWQGRAARLAVIWDVTEMDRTRDELRRNHDMLAELTETLTARTADLVDAARLARMGTWSRQFEPRHLVWSPEVYAILGRDPQSFTLDEESILACIHPDDAESFREVYRCMRETGTDHQFEFRIRRPSGEIRVLREIARPRRDAQGRITGMAGVVQDVTDQKLAADALLRAEKLKTMGQITGGIAHDFNNLLAVISLNLETALDAASLTADQRELLQPALHAARRGGELTAQLLSYARRQSLRPVVADLGAMVITLQPLLTRAVGDRHQLQIDAPAHGLTVSIDPGQFENALMNLTINARDALAEAAGRPACESRIAITVAPVELRHSLAGQPDTVPPGRYARVRTADTGSGIAPELLQRVLEPFFTTKPLGTGSGLGLSMVYGFVHQSQGRMSIESSLGQGTCIDLYFPLADRPADLVPARRATRPMPRLCGHALLVEDRDDLRETMLRIFRKIGFTGTAVASGEAALDWLRGPQPVDLLFSDILLPGGIDGPTLAEAAERVRPGLNVVLTSGDTRQVDASRIRWPVLSKPFRISALMELLGDRYTQG